MAGNSSDRSSRVGRRVAWRADTRAIQAAGLVLLLTAAGFALRWLSIDSRGLWLDEAITVNQASRPLAQIAGMLAAGVHPPLYHLLMHLWIGVLGRGEVALRSFSVLVGVIAIPCAYWAGTRLFDRRTGLIAAGLVALSPFQIWYSQEARMYELLFLGGLLSTAAFGIALRDNRGWSWVRYLLFTLIGLFTHYFFLFVLLMQAVFYLFSELVFRQRPARRDDEVPVRHGAVGRLLRDTPTLARWLVCMLIVGTLLGGWAYLFLRAQAVNGTNALVSSASGSGLGYGQEPPRLALRFNDSALVISQMTFGFHTVPLMDITVAMWPLAVYLSLLLMRIIGPSSRSTRLLMAVGLGGGGLMMALGQWQGQVLSVRYFTPVVGALFLLVARLLVRLRPHVVVPVMALLVALSLASWADQSFNPSNGMRYDNREAFATIVGQWKPGDTIIYVPFYIDPIVGYYLPDSLPAVGFPQYGQYGALRVSQGEVSQDLATVVGTSDRVWVVLCFQDVDQLRADGYAVRYWLKHHGFKVALDEKRSRVELLRYEGAPVPADFFSDAGAGSSR